MLQLYCGGDIMEIGSRIKHLRELLGISQEELAKRVGYKSRSSINKIEIDGRGLPQSKIVDFAKALGTTPAYLMGWDEQDIFDTYQFHDYLDEYVHEIGEFLYYNPEHKVLFDSSMEVKNQDIGLAKQMLDRINGKQSTTESYYLNAARERTDIEVTEEMKKHDDDIMDDENF